VVSALPPHHAQKILDPEPPWNDIQAVSVGTVTFFWPESKPINYDGFGYVISNATPMEQNPHGALGVIFDSATRPAQDKAWGQKVTILLGGEYWVPGLEKGMKLPTKEELIKQAEETLEVQLGVTEKAKVISAAILPQCIPQPTVDFMKSVHSKANPDVKTWAKHWNNRLHLTGPPVSGPGVHDCVGGAWNTVGSIIQNEFAEIVAKHEAQQLDSVENNFAERWLVKAQVTNGIDMAVIMQQYDMDRFAREDCVPASTTEDVVGADMLWPPPTSRNIGLQQWGPVQSDANGDPKLVYQGWRLRSSRSGAPTLKQ
jgi:hypothetical protein